MHVQCTGFDSQRSSQLSVQLLVHLPAPTPNAGHIVYLSYPVLPPTLLSLYSAVSQPLPIQGSGEHR